MSSVTGGWFGSNVAPKNSMGGTSSRRDISNNACAAVPSMENSFEVSGPTAACALTLPGQAIQRELALGDSTAWAGSGATTTTGTGTGLGISILLRKRRTPQNSAACADQTSLFGGSRSLECLVLLEAGAPHALVNVGV